MGDFSSQIAALSAKKRALLLRHLSQAQKGRSAQAKLVPQQRESDRLPLSFAQQRLWFLDQLNPGSSFYNMSEVIALDGEFAVASLERSLDEIVRRHEALRTTFVVADDQPLQCVAASMRVPLPLIDFRGLSKQEKESQVRRRTGVEMTRAFDLARGPMLRALLLRLDKRRHVLIVSVHHIVFDGWSLGVFLRELSSLYNAFMAGRPSPLPELPLQYGDFALWQRRWLEGEVFETQLGYWKQQLDGAPEALELPTDRARQAVESFRGAIVPGLLDTTMTRELKALSQRQGVTAFMPLLAALKALFWRYTGQEDMVLGAAVANRTREQLEELIGFFVNTLVLRSDLSGDPSFGELLERVRKVSLAAYSHQDLPFEKLVEELEPERTLSRNPLCQVIVGYQRVAESTLELAGLEAIPVETERWKMGTARFDLTLFLWDLGERIEGAIEYNTDLFHATTITRLWGHLRSILGEVLGAPERRLSQLSLLSRAERHQVTAAWNDTRTEYADETCLHRLFEAWVIRAPEAVALAFGDRQLTYRELDRRSNQLAHGLRRLGVGREVPVAVCLERSIELIVTLLGILKAGGAYVPLDPSYPWQRLELMLTDTGAPVLLTRRGLLSVVEPAAGLRIVFLDGSTPTLRPGSQDRSSLPPSGAGSPEGLAYVMYTSGSTGRPKGITVTHRAVARLVLGTDYCQVEPSDRVAQVSNAAFDAATFEIWGALLNGACLVGIAREVILQPAEFASQLRSLGIDAMFLTTALFNQVAREFPGAFGSMRCLIVGGDAVDPEQSRAVLECSPPKRLLNGYGPTENTTFSCWYSVREVPEGAITVPIGRPIANSTAHVFDRATNPVAVGATGELYVGGAGLARGYLRRPGLTAERFLPDASGAPGARLYRTGDLARCLADGRIECLGRIDHQVKIRGFRIELGEIEVVLEEHPAVREAVVLARQEAMAGGGRRLVAYVVQDLRYRGEDSPEPAGQWEAQQVSQWAMIFDDIYARPGADTDPRFDITGWDNTFTGEPIPAEEMREWLDDTVDRILDLRPRRVLELGCGTGLLLFRIAPSCERYLGTDISQRSLDDLEQRLDSLEPGLPQVTLARSAADDFRQVASGEIDAVVLNSVVQYFPSAEYLLAVLEGAVEAVAAGGFVFLGDLRSLPLLELFHTSLELHKATDSLTVAGLRQHVQAALIEEDELAVDPAFFFALQSHLPRVSRVEILPKRGRHHNELTRFRYQVVLHVETPVLPEEQVRWLDWRREGLSLNGLRQLLLDTAPAVLGLERVPNARLSSELSTRQLVAADDPLTVGVLRDRLRAAKVAGLDPQELWAWSEEVPYEAHVSWARHGADGEYDVVLRRRTPDAERLAAAPPRLPEPTASQPLRVYTNRPLQGKFARKVVPELRAFLDRRLPEYMVPVGYVLLDALPLNPNGKVDRRALPAPGPARPESREGFAAPRTGQEKALADIFSEVLGVEQVGLKEDFFSLGGHSLLATQVISRLNQAFAVDLPLRALFESPTVAGLAARTEEARRAPAGHGAPPLRPVERPSELPLSFAQERLWFLNQLEAASSFYNSGANLRLAGFLDLRALERSVASIVERHETLRTSFPAHAGQPVQEIALAGGWRLPLVDLGALAATAREAELHRRATAAHRRGFDLARGPLIRLEFYQLAADDHVLVLNLHHSVFDGWSLGIFVRELGVLYRALAQGESPVLPELPVQYADFALWQRQWLQGEVLAGYLGYWRRQMAGVPVLELPTDRPRPAVKGYRGASCRWALPEQLSRALVALAEGHGATLFVLGLAAFQTLMARLTGQRDIAVGSPIANRNRLEIEGLIGCFVNTLVLRGDLSGDPSFAQLLSRGREVALDGYAHQDLPFEKLVEELQPERSLSHNPLFQVMFALQNAPLPPLQLPGMTLDYLETAVNTAIFDLMLSLWDETGHLEGNLEYDTDLFDATTAVRMSAQFRNLLAGIAEDPEQRLSQLPLLSASELHQLLVEWNHVSTRSPSGEPPIFEPGEDVVLHQLFAVQARRRRQAVALVDGERRLTYGELDRRARALGSHLRSLGVGAETLVAVCVERTAEMVVGLLATLEAGAGYVALDPEYPPDRLAFILEDTRAPVVLTQAHLLARLPENGAKVVLLESAGHGGGAQAWPASGGEDMARHPPMSPGGTATGPVPSNLAYVLYTSGSTGRPKGVAVEHRSAVALVRWALSVYGRRELAGVLASTSISFDLSVFEIFVPLSGGTTVILAGNVLALPGLASAPEVTLINTVPSAARELVGSGAVPASVRTVNLAGEALPGELVEQLYERLPVERVLNLYGPSEDTTYSTFARVPRGAAAEPSIGRPVAGTRAYVSDASLCPVPPGVPGELVLGGAGLARSYLRRPALSAEKFVPDPFGEWPGSRLYATGDLARLRTDGELEFLGRRDHQIKLRGFRIELGEIETALGKHRGVAEAVVVARQDGPGGQRLFACVVAAGEPAPTGSRLASYLAGKLPGYMVPSAFDFLERLPRTPNGKVDRASLGRRALPAAARSEAARVEPSTLTEQLLAEIWSEVLGVESLGVDDHFFQLGGHSLLATRVIARLRQALEVDLELRSLFEAPTIAGLAAVVDALLEEQVAALGDREAEHLLAVQEST